MILSENNFLWHFYVFLSSPESSDQSEQIEGIIKQIKQAASDVEDSKRNCI